MSYPSIIVAPWGNPFTWAEVTYNLRGQGAGGSTQSVKARTSLACLVRALNPKAVNLIIPETLLCPGNKQRKEFEEYAKKPLEDILEVIDNDDYGNALKILKSAIERFYEEHVLAKARGPTPYITLAPTIGEYRCGNRSYMWEIISKVDPISAYAAYALTSIVSTVVKLNPKDEIILALDTTHGLNYMPLAAYRATMAAARILSAGLNINVRFRQYNSAPYTRGVEKLDIFTVKEETITPNKAIQRLVYSYLAREPGKARPFLRAARLSSELNRQLNMLQERLKDLKELHEKVYSLASAIHFSMPLAFLQLGLMNRGTDIKKLINELDRILGELLNYVEVATDEKGRVRIRHIAVPRYDDIKSFLAATSISSYATHALDVEKPPINSREGLVEASLILLENVTNKWLKGPLLKVVEHEISTFRKAYQGEEVGGKIIRELIEKAIAREGEWVSLEDKCEEQVRIYVAHAGLVSNSIEIKVQKDQLHVRYRRQCLEQLRNCLKGALKGTQKLILGR